MNKFYLLFYSIALRNLFLHSPLFYMYFNWYTCIYPTCRYGFRITIQLACKRPLLLDHFQFRTIVLCASLFLPVTDGGPLEIYWNRWMILKFNPGTSRVMVRGPFCQTVHKSQNLVPVTVNLFVDNFPSLRLCWQLPFTEAMLTTSLHWGYVNNFPSLRLFEVHAWLTTLRCSYR